MRDNLSNLLSTIKNGYTARLSTVNVPYTKLSLNVLDALERGGYIKGYKYLHKENDSTKSTMYIMVLLRYHENEPTISTIMRISSSGRRVYVGSEGLKPFKSGLGTYILSSSKGVLLDTEAKSLGIGGEILCKLN